MIILMHSDESIHHQFSCYALLYFKPFFTDACSTSWEIDKQAFLDRNQVAEGCCMPANPP